MKRCSLVFLFLFSCDNQPSVSNAKVWTQADHDGEKSSQPFGLPGKQATAAPLENVESTELLAEALWQKQCVSCHGSGGEGNGPLGGATGAKNLLEPSVQQASDDSLKNVLRNGKGKMPKFDLSEAMLTALTKKIKSLPKK